MSPRVRLMLFTAAGAVLGITIGVDLADGSYGWAVVAAAACCWLVLNRLSAAPVDAWLIAVALVGYVVGNRGFAQLQPSGLIPLLPAEGVLLVAAPALIVRMVLKQSAGVRRDFLNYAILAWMLIGAVRLPLDMRQYGVIALRDFAMVYYASFFFIAQALGAQAPAARLLRSSLTVAFVLLLPAVISILVSPDFLMDHFTWAGIPIIYHKSDLIATSLSAGYFWLWTRWMKSGHRAWIAVAAVSLLLIAAMASPRSGIFAVAATTALWLYNRRWRMAAAQVGIVAVASVLSLAVLSVMGKDIRTSAPYSMYEHAVSIFDPAGTGSYINGESGDPGENNRFRLIWWRDVIDETATTSPAFGLGFGSDLAARFLADYNLLGDETFAARSPHSMIVTVFGRMGTLGLLAWIAVSAGMARMIWRLFRGGTPDGLGLASIVCVIWISSCVGVVLESPMAAVIFWTVVGLANASLQGVPQLVPATPGEGEWPVAKAAALGVQSDPR